MQFKHPVHRRIFSCGASGLHQPLLVASRKEICAVKKVCVVQYVRIDDYSLLVWAQVQSMQKGSTIRECLVSGEIRVFEPVTAPTFASKLAPTVP